MLLNKWHRIDRLPVDLNKRLTEEASAVSLAVWLHSLLMKGMLTLSGGMVKGELESRIVVRFVCWICLCSLRSVI